MIRTALQPRWLALLAVVLVVCVAFGWLGAWQLGVARDKGQQRALRAVAASPRVPVQQVVQPQRSFPAAAVGRRVDVDGGYDPARQVLVSGRSQGGRDGSWVVTAVQVGGGWLPVVRGFVPAGATGPAPPSGAVHVEGVLQPDEAPPDVPASASGAAAGTVATLDAADLANRWGTPIYNGYVVLTAESAGTAAAQGVPLQRVPAPSPPSGGVAWRNAAYAVQWWLFAAFALVLWWRMVGQSHQDRLDEQAGAAAEVPSQLPRVQGVR